ncbi:methyltransferase domain-containing protein [Ktedonosporobacter rubrisoli]|uniref:Methyltransferase domain-containing protein n=1 Tax=Ktedonosporobacter rubrisoli TaxID=2509675 RepID=A0A4P6JM26_KTERU|nr:methyltransferase domain-containing protein [Ktedonosporobacter rubrisoli]QBD76299.1 methyltransferase domain-containing protein [Ktedonosporobacter rubrisoli]
MFNAIEREKFMEQTPQRSAQEQKAQVQEYFSRTAANYVTSATHRQGKDLKRLIELGEWEPRFHALDVATGGGHTALAIAPYVAQVMVSDLTPTMLETARAFLLSQGVTNAQFQVADAENLPFADASFERVTCRIAPHHFPNVGKAVQEVARVLKPGGLFLLIDNIAPSDPALDAFCNRVEKWRDKSHGRCYTQEEWQSFFARAGLVSEHSETFRKTHNYDEWTARSQLAASEKAALAAFILQSEAAIQRYFAVNVDDDGHLKDFTTDTLLLKGRKPLA